MPHIMGGTRRSLMKGGAASIMVGHPAAIAIPKLCILQHVLHVITVIILKVAEEAVTIEI